MPVSRNNARRGRVVSILCAGLALALPALPVLAQIGPPVRLTPPPGLPDNAPPGAPAPTERPRAPQGVTVDPLAPISPDSVGTLGAADRAFPDTLWQGTTRLAVLALLPRIGTTTSPALQDLAYRLLASGATPPAGKGESGALLGLRAERLTNALGRAETALILLQSLPPGQRNEDLAKVGVDLAFLAGNIPDACAQIHEHDRSWQGTYWDQGTVTCQALDGQAAQARLGLDVLREAKFKDDGFAVLVDRALGTDGKLPDALPSPQPMALALLAKAGQGVPKKALDSAKLPVFKAVAIGDGFPADQRLIAAEKAVAYGALEPDWLSQAYLAVQIDEADRESPLNRADAAGGAKGRAILFQAARDAPTPGAKANFLQALFAKTQRTELYLAVIRAAERQLLEIPPTPDLKPVAVDFARALYALDRPNDAGQWLDLAGPEAGAGLLPLSHIVAGAAAPPWGEEPLADLLQPQGGKKDPALAQRRAVLAAQLLAAEGTPLPDRMILPLVDAKIGVPGSVGAGLLIDSEASAKHLGGTALAVLAALGDDGANAPSALVADAVAGLRAAGLGPEARRLAIDAAIGAGL
jgi:hypothetical protein